jgi:hypothetical protein
MIRRDFLSAGLDTAWAATLSERAAAESGDVRARDTTGCECVAAGRDEGRPKVNLDGWQMTATEITIPAGRAAGTEASPSPDL